MKRQNKGSEKEMNLSRKLMVVAIIGLFIGAGVVPSIIGENQTITTLEKSNPSIEWEKEYTISDINLASCIRQTDDEGFILCGTVGNGYNLDFLLLKLDILGDVEWYKTYDNSYRDLANYVEQTSDGGYIIAGYSASDFWVIKADSQGNIEWDNIFDYHSIAVVVGGGSINQTNDGGYVLSFAIYTFSNDEDSIMVIKIDAQGEIEWETYIENAYVYDAAHVCQTNDGGYIVAGCRYENYDRNGLLVKLDSTGTIEWDVTDSYSDHYNFVEQTSEGTFIVCGDGRDALIALYTENGQICWDREFPPAEHAYEIHETEEGGYITIGEVGWYDTDYWVMKMNSWGDIQWNITIDKDYNDVGTSIMQTSDGGYICSVYSSDELWETCVIWVVKIKGNTPPDTPIIIEGPRSGKVGVNYLYTFEVTDPDEDDVYYFIDWGDNTNSSWRGPYSSGHHLKMSHTWENKGRYQIRVKAKDIFYEESDWASLKVTMPKSKVCYGSLFWFFERIMDRFPFLEIISQEYWRNS